MKIGDIAKRLNTTVRTLRYYEEEGLIHPLRSEKGTRLYDESDLERFEALLFLSRLNIPLQTLSELTTIRASSCNGNAAGHRVYDQLQRMREAIQLQISALQQADQDMQLAQNFAQRCYGCRKRANLKNCSPCDIAAGRQNIQTMKVVWDEPERA